MFLLFLFCDELINRRPGWQRLFVIDSKLLLESVLGPLEFVELQLVLQIYLVLLEIHSATISRQAFSVDHGNRQVTKERSRQNVNDASRL